MGQIKNIKLHIVTDIKAVTKQLVSIRDPTDQRHGGGNEKEGQIPC